MRELNDLYQAVLLDHARQPRNHRRLATATAICEGNDPLCGDRCKVYLEIARLICEEKLTPREVIARVEMSPVDIEETMKDLLRRGVVTLKRQQQ